MIRWIKKPISLMLLALLLIDGGVLLLDRLSDAGLIGFAVALFVMSGLILICFLQSAIKK